MDLSTCGWDGGLVRALGVGAAEGALPTIVSCAEEIGRVDGGPLHGDAAHGEEWRPAGPSSHLQAVNRRRSRGGLETSRALFTPPSCEQAPLTGRAGDQQGPLHTSKL